RYRLLPSALAAELSTRARATARIATLRRLHRPYQAARPNVREIRCLASRKILGNQFADHLSKRGWSWVCVSAIDSQARTIWIVDAGRSDGKRFVVHADQKLTAFKELEAVNPGGLQLHAIGPCKVPNVQRRNPDGYRN